ncbi:hypothetical protein BDZ91DRAFT_470483 [Kalaharituber pfeilii]|nr:hypothetical protein BDZ91DRAFT_470483 [Kalaharituber pfeilii]
MISRFFLYPLCFYCLPYSAIFHQDLLALSRLKFRTCTSLCVSLRFFFIISTKRSFCFTWHRIYHLCVNLLGCIMVQCYQLWRWFLHFITHTCILQHLGLEAYISKYSYQSIGLGY